ncbi:cysteine--tRNA ligase [Sneathiella sp. CAU 1612]|uniref:Cysteine--tRNA ligase n=1 Tax=Sneathiella sedimenti TaxID=2816034 RepID=A0ABS3F8I1_9PROT|nr:cysteine--tRNA ligase [Sneathiella sedimenti]
MTLQLYNTAHRKKEEFVPLKEGEVGMYVCGPTVYDFAHIGNARPVVIFDVLARLLRHEGYKLTYVRNITDVEDKIIAAAEQNGETIDDLTRRTTEAYHADMAALNALPPDIEPRATEHIDGMIRMIEKLIKKGHAYEAEGHVLFDVTSMADYGKLSGRNRDDMIAGARVEVAPYKKDPADFVLWKPSTDDMPGWDSPFGRGRPGWHIECSVMSEATLGITFDIHGGGRDLIFPHHENEVAQSCCAHDGAPFARYWVHNGFLTVEGDKMSKSLGNFRTVRELLADAPGEALRLNMLSAQYRQPLDWTAEGVARAKASLDRLYTALQNLENVETGPIEPAAGVIAALEDDLNTPQALTELYALAGEANKATEEAEKARIKGQLLGSGRLLGLLQQSPEDWFRKADSGDISEQEIEQAITARIEAKKEKDFAKADAIRDDLAKKKVVLEDGPNGTTWKRA